MANGELMLQLAHLLHRNPDWRANKVRVLQNEQAKAEIVKHMDELASSARIQFQSEVVMSDDPVASVIQSTSQNASLVLLGFQTPEEDQEIAMYESLEALAGELPRVIMVDSVGGMTLES